MERASHPLVATCFYGWSFTLLGLAGFFVGEKL
jgi:hypothetical protein